MKRHAARLAASWSVVLIASLVAPPLARAEGWHIVTAPILEKPWEKFRVDLDAPLSEWKDAGASFDSARECQAYLDRERNKPLTPREVFERRLKLNAADTELMRLMHTTREDMILSAMAVEFAVRSARCVPFEPPEVPTATVAKRARASVVTIQTYDRAGRPLSLGAGTIDGRIFDFDVDAFLEGTPRPWDVVVTSFHVVRAAWSATVALATGETVPVRGVLAEDQAHDLVILAIPAGAATARGLFCAATEPQPGERVVAIGAPHGLGWSVSAGEVGGYAQHASLGRLVQFTAPISPGSSGGPLLNLRGEVVGYVTMYLTEGQNLNFAVPCETANQMVVLKPPLPLPGQRKAGGSSQRALPRTDQPLPSDQSSGSRATAPRPPILYPTVEDLVAHDHQ